MRLSPVSSGTELFVTILEGKREDRSPAPGQNPLVCLLLPGINEAMEIIQMTDLAKMIALETLPAGGLLIHGALAERDGYGVILAAPSGTGKTTASNRLPPPWHALSDDATLVVPDGSGNYIAHPWPTWSRFFDNGPGGSWEVEQGIPLAAVFFLSQSQEDHAEPLNTSEAAAYLMQSVHQIMGAPARPGCTREESASLCGMELTAVNALVTVIPAFLLRISLTGTFWNEIASVPGQQSVAVRTDRAKKASLSSMTVYPAGFSGQKNDLFGAGHIPIVYSGSSMNPTLQAPDLLDVMPYTECKPAVGDIICFTRPDTINIVHRIIRITPCGIRTQGDNSTMADLDLINEDRVIGRVISATRAKHTRNIAGGMPGRIARQSIWIRKSAINTVFRIIRIAKPALVITRASAHLLPGSWKPRIVLFSYRHTRILRLFFGATVAGEFNTIRNKWIIRFPFLLLVDESVLPVVEPPEPANT
jgi:SynChlorMet cassette protein ScmC